MRRAAAFGWPFWLCGLLYGISSLANPDGPRLRGLLERSIEAHGFDHTGSGEIKSFHAKQDVNMTIDGREIPCRWIISGQTPNRRRMEMLFGFEGKPVVVTSIYDGIRGKGWNTSAGKTREMSSPELEENKQATHAVSLLGLLALRDSHNYHLSSAGRITIEGETAVGMKVWRQGFREVILFFNEKSGLVVRHLYVLKNLSKGGEAKILETTFSKFGKKNGLMLPKTFKSRLGGKIFASGSTTNLVVVDGSLPKGTFWRP